MYTKSHKKFQHEDLALTVSALKNYKLHTLKNCGKKIQVFHNRRRTLLLSHKYYMYKKKFDHILSCIHCIEKKYIQIKVTLSIHIFLVIVHIYTYLLYIFNLI